ncbi:MAG: hypothetical protein AAF483_18745 [Planctomycetota bacterium]
MIFEACHNDRPWRFSPFANHARYTCFLIASILSIASIVCFHGLSLHAQEPSTDESQSESDSSVLIAFPNESSVALPKFQLQPGQSAADKKLALEAIAGKIGWKRFSFKGLSSPVRIEIEELAAEQSRIGYSIRSAYILYASREQLEDRNLMETSFGKPKAPNDPTRKLDQLAMNQLLPSDLELEESTEDKKTNYLWLELPLLKKILIRSVLAADNANGEDFFSLNWQLDPRFSHPDVQGKYRNRWSKLSTNQLGKIVEGASQSYLGMGGALRIVATEQEPDQWLVESVLVIHEPEEWFRHGKYLRSKLGAALQESAKSFRRKLR